MKREKVEERMKVLQAQKNRKLAEVNALEGAIEDCQYWLNSFDEKPPEKKGAKK